MDLAERQGSLLRGTYRLDRVLGRGGMGVVFSARHERLDSEVAVKLLSPELARDARALQRFFDEARAAAKLSHPNVIRVFDVDVEDGTPFLVMERLHGESLADRLEREGRLSPRAALRVVEPVLDALEASHAVGIVHRDIKPDNIFLAEEAGAVVPKLLDFGIAKLRGSDAVTGTGVAIGTPAYMAPEQAAGRSSLVGPWTDVWSVGVVLYECLAGRMHYEVEPDGGAMAWLSRLATEPPRSLALTAPDVPPSLAAAVDAALALAPDERPPSAAALRTALGGDEALVSAPTLAAPSTPPSAFASTPPTREASAPKSGWKIGLGLGAIVLTVAITAWLATRLTTAPAAPSPVRPAEIAASPEEEAAPEAQPPAPEAQPPAPEAQPPAPEAEPPLPEEPAPEVVVEPAAEREEPAPRATPRPARSRRRPRPEATSPEATSPDTPARTRTGAWSADQL